MCREQLSHKLTFETTYCDTFAWAWHDGMLAYKSRYLYAKSQLHHLPCAKGGAVHRLVVPLLLAIQCCVLRARVRDSGYGPNDGNSEQAIPPLATARFVRAFRAARPKPRTPSFGVDHPGIGRKNEILLVISPTVDGRGSSAGAGAGHAYKGGFGWGALRRGRLCVLRQLQNLGNGARALRKYACDANAIWETLHASDELGHATRQLQDVD
eukprot:6184789-Pleurochrysis_carterae.AAC.2